jgi:hypothetical protein
MLFGLYKDIKICLGWEKWIYLNDVELKIVDLGFSAHIKVKGCS